LIGATALIAREREAEIYDGAQCTPTDGQSRYDRCSVNRDIGSAAQTIGIAVFVGSVAAIAISGALILGDRSAPSLSASAAKPVRCGPWAAGITCGGSF
jgi:hypothetical protein